MTKKMHFKTECLSSGGVACPYCGKRNTYQFDDPCSSEDDTAILVKSECHDCGMEWASVFRIEDVVEND